MSLGRSNKIRRGIEWNTSAPQLLVCASDVNIRNINTIKKSTEVVLSTSEEVGLEVNT
jgi:hypothetical protein